MGSGHLPIGGWRRVCRWCAFAAIRQVSVATTLYHPLVACRENSEIE